MRLRFLLPFLIVGLPQNITKEGMIDVRHGLLLVCGEERINLLDGALSIFPVWSGLDTVLKFCYSLVSFLLTHD